jgi:hypothetical protein
MMIIISPKNMVDYLFTFLSIIIGYIVIQFFEGWRIIITEVALHNLYWLHICWTLFLFIYILHLWWVFGHYREQISVNFFSFLLTLLPCFLFWLITKSIFPDYSNDLANINLKYYYYQQSAYIFSGYSLLMIVSIIGAPYLFEDRKFWTRATFSRFILLAIFLIARVETNPIYHVLTFIANCLITSWFILEYNNGNQIVNKQTRNTNANQEPL